MPWCSRYRRGQFLSPPILRFCGLIQALVTNPDSTAPVEEAESVGEVLEVRKRGLELEEGKGLRAREPPSHPSPAV